MKRISKKAKNAIIILTSIVMMLVLGFLSFIFYILWFNDNVEVVYDAATKTETEEITIMSFNVRCLAFEDTGDKSWFKRAPYLIGQIKDNEPDIICFQEVTQIHAEYLNQSFKGFNSVYKYRNSGYSEATPIYFNTLKFEKIDEGGFWLSETPEKQSKGWGAANYRVCSYVVLKQISNGKEFVVFNTHLDHKSKEARINGIQLVLNKIDSLGSLPALLLGDMNDYVNSETYAFATNKFDDSRVVAVDTMEPTVTWNGYGTENEGTEIDFCFMTKGKFDVNQYRVLNEKCEIMPSDHYALKIKFDLK